MESNSIERLNSQNYSTWREDVRAILMEKGCWRIVNGEEKQPAEGDSDKIKLSFSQRKDKAYSLLYLSTEKEYRSLVSNSDDPVKTWKILADHFRPDSRARVIGLTDEYFSCKPDPDEEIGLYGARLKKIAAQLNDAGKPISSWYQSFQLIRFLPTEFSSIVQAIYRWEDSKFQFDEVLKELVAEEARLRQSQKDQELVVYQANRHSTNQPRRGNSSNRSRGSNRGNYRRPQKKRYPSTSNRGMPNPTSLILEANATVKRDNLHWVFDTAATSHFCNSKHLMKDFHPIENTSVAVAVGGVTCPVEGRGTVMLQFRIEGELETILLRNVLYSPSLRQNLISGTVIDKAGHSFVGKNNVLTVFHKDGRKLFYGKNHNGLFIVKPMYPKNVSNTNVSKSENVNNVKRSNNNCSFSTGSDNSLSVWHKRFAHINTKYIVNTSLNASVNGLPNLKHGEVKCEPCKVAKSRRKTFKPINRVRSNKPLQLIHMDLCGPLPNTAIGGYRYFLTITDDYSRKVNTYPVKEKRDVFKVFSGYQKRVERFLNHKIVSVKTDNGLEFCNKEFDKMFEELGIRAERTNVYTPEQNGVAERFNYTAVDAVKAILKDSGMGNHFWAEALLYFTYTWNRVVHGNQKITPCELFGGHKPSVKHLKAFGTTAYLGVPKQLRKKLDMRAKKGVMVGYAHRTRGFRIWIPSEKKVVESINVSFDEDKCGSGAELDPKNKPMRLLSESGSEESDSDHEGKTEVSSDEEDSVDESISESTMSQEPTPGVSNQIQIPLKEVSWSRKVIPRKDGSRNDVYYYPKGTKTRLRSYNDVKKFCESNNIPYDQSKFNFRVNNIESGDEESNSTSA